jgi:monovalent cation/proton antiporter MnhG/PhaG subunit
VHHAQIASWLVGVATGLTIICAIGLAIVKTTLERLHFSAAVTSLGAGLIALAVWFADPAWQAKIKATLIAIVLFLMNSILSHATARAIRIYKNGQLEPRTGGEISRMPPQNFTGARR